jgi:hypothetical protein
MHVSCSLQKCRLPEACGELVALGRVDASNFGDDGPRGTGFGRRSGKEVGGAMQWPSVSMERYTPVARWAR